MARRTVLHRRIRELRLRAGMSQEDLADVLGIDKTSVSHWELGMSAPKHRRLDRVARALGVSVAELYVEAA